MKFPDFGQNNVANEWNMVAGYYDLLYRLLFRYYEASLTPGVTDDLETFKRILDHCCCKIDNMKADKLKYTRTYWVETEQFKDKRPDIMMWFDSEIEKIEGSLAVVMRKYKPGYRPTPQDMEAESSGRKRLRLLMRDLMICMDSIGSFSKEYKIRTPKKMMANLLGQGDDEEDE